MWAGECMIPDYLAEFTGTLFRSPGPSGWVFVMVPPHHAPGATLGWGRTPVRATVDGRSWETSVWREKSGRTLLAVPKKIRAGKDHDDSVRVRIEYSGEYRPEVRAGPPPG
jgi:hypothetical protein